MSGGSVRPLNILFYFFSIFKVFIEFVTILLMSYILVFWPWGVWDLSSPSRDRTPTPCIRRWSLSHWTTREVPKVHIILRGRAVLWQWALSHLQGSRAGVSVLVSAVFPIRSHLQVHGGHEFRGTLFTPAHYPGGHTLAACLHLGFQGAGIWVPLPLLTQVSFLEARPTRWGFPPKWGMSGSLTVKKQEAFPNQMTWWQ